MTIETKMPREKLGLKMVNSLPIHIDICGEHYTKDGCAHPCSEKLKPVSYVVKTNIRSYSCVHTCPNDGLSWGNVISSKLYRYCATCGMEIDRECLARRHENFIKARDDGLLRGEDYYYFGDDDELIIENENNSDVELQRAKLTGNYGAYGKDWVKL